MLLPLNYNDETKVDIALCACIEDRSIPWFYENYINLVVRKGSYLCAEFEDCFLADFSLIQSIRINAFTDFASSADYLSFIMHRIDNGYYISSYFYEKYQPDKSADTVYESVSFILIYGYDNERIFYLKHDTVNGVIKCESDFSDAEEMFDELSLRYNEILSPSQKNEFALELTYNSSFKNRKFHIKTFLDNLNRYIFSISKQTEHIVGFDVYNEYIKVLNDYSMPIVYRGLENIVKHKEFLLNRFNYIRNIYAVSGKCEKLLSEYKIRIVAALEKMRLKCIKQGITSNEGLIILSNDSAFRSKISGILSDVREIERELLLSIYSELKNISHRVAAPAAYSEFLFEVQDENTAVVDLKNPQYLAGVDLVDAREYLSYAAPAKIKLDNGATHYLYDSSVSGIRLRELQFKPVLVDSFYIYQDNLSYMEKSSVVLYVLPSEYFWQEASLHEWKAVQQFSEINYRDDIECVVYNNNPYFVMDEKYVNADVAKYIYIKYETLSNSEAAQIWFIDEAGGNYDFDKLKTFSTKQEKGIYEHKIDMSNVKKWRGIVSKLRFDPVHYDHSGTAEIKIHSIRICDEMPVYNNEDFCGNQGVNGWFYYSYNGDITYKELIWNDKDDTWISHNNKELKIGKDIQSSSKQIASVRRWVCPASGTYLIKVSITPITECTSAVFQLKKNFSTIIFEEGKMSKLENFTAKNEVVLERGEYLSFELLNRDELSIECIQIQLDIAKIN